MTKPLPLIPVVFSCELLMTILRARGIRGHIDWPRALALLGGSALALPFAMTPHSAEQWLILAGIGVVGLLGQILLTTALRFGAVASVIVMDYSGLIWATLFGWLVFGNLPPWTTWLGAPLVVGAGILIAWREQGALAAARPAEPIG